MTTTRKRILWLVLGILVLMVAVPIGYYVFFLKLIRVPTGAMANTIIPGDLAIVKKRAFGAIDRGDVIVFAYPKDTSVKYIFRVIGLPRETVEVRGELIYINGNELPEQRVTVSSDFAGGALKELSTEGTGPYRVFYAAREGGEPDGSLPAEGEESFGIKAPFQIPDNEYYVMGDNRDNSFDSRYWGTVPKASISGKATMIFWSAGRDEAGNETPRWERIFSKIRIER